MKRYSLEASVEQCDCGDFVKYADHCHAVYELETEIKKLEGANKVLSREYSATTFYILQGKCERLEKKNGALEHRIRQLSSLLDRINTLTCGIRPNEIK